MEIVHLMKEREITHVRAIMGLWVQHVTIQIIAALTHVVNTECVQTLKMVFTIFANAIMAIKEPNARQLIVVLLTLAMGKARVRTKPRRLTINVHAIMDIEDPLVKLIRVLIPLVILESVTLQQNIHIILVLVRLDTGDQHVIIRVIVNKIHVVVMATAQI